MYAILVTLAHAVVPFRSPLAVALATLTAVALFNPLRHRVQRTVDRRFNRAHYDAEATIAAFADRMRDATDLDEIRRDLLAVAYQVVEPAHVSVGSARAGQLRICRTVDDGKPIAGGFEAVDNSGSAHSIQSPEGWAGQAGVRGRILP